MVLIGNQMTKFQKRLKKWEHQIKEAKLALNELDITQKNCITDHKDFFFVPVIHYDPMSYSGGLMCPCEARKLLAKRIMQQQPTKE